MPENGTESAPPDVVLFVHFFHVWVLICSIAVHIVQLYVAFVCVCPLSCACVRLVCASAKDEVMLVRHDGQDVCCGACCKLHVHSLVF